jgi:hypothetical protein
MGYSAVFLAVLGYGYYYLFSGVGPAGWLLTTILPLVAWGIAKIIGTSPEGIRGHIPFFLLLLTLSAAGVFNALMLHLEGPLIFKETVDSASARYAQIDAARERMRYPDGEETQRRERAARRNFLEELVNSQNCGEGKAAHDRLEELQEIFRDLRELSNPPAGCTGRGDPQIDRRVREYSSKIDEFEKQAAWQQQLQQAEALRARAQTEVVDYQGRLSKLATSINAGESLLPLGLTELESIAADYRSLAAAIARDFPALAITPELDLAAVRGLGQWSQIANLLKARADRPQTYVYLFVAVFADWMLIYQFGLLSHSLVPVTHPKSKAKPGYAVWK